MVFVLDAYWSQIKENIDVQGVVYSINMSEIFIQRKNGREKIQNIKFKQFWAPKI